MNRSPPGTTSKPAYLPRITSKVWRNVSIDNDNDDSPHAPTEEEFSRKIDFTDSQPELPTLA